MDATLVPEPVAKFAGMSGTDAATYSRDRPGMSAFVLEDGVVYQTYSTYARGLDGFWGVYQWPRPRSQGAQRDGCLVPPPRRIREGLIEARLQHHSPVGGSSSVVVLSQLAESGSAWQSIRAFELLIDPVARQFRGRVRTCQ
jgi:hypothetical protein